MSIKKKKMPLHHADVIGTNNPRAQIIVKCGTKPGSDVF